MLNKRVIHILKNYYLFAIPGTIVFLVLLEVFYGEPSVVFQIVFGIVIAGYIVLPIGIALTINTRLDEMNLERERIEFWKADIKERLGRRNNIIRQVVALADRAADHEREIIFHIAENATNIAKALQSPLNGPAVLVTLATAYPQLKGDEGFREAQKQFADLEISIESSLKELREAIFRYNSYFHNPIHRAIISNFSDFQKTEYALEVGVENQNAISNSYS